MKRLTVVGDAMLDRDLDGRVERVAPDAPVPVVSNIAAHIRPGGAALSAALAADAGTPVTLVTALGDDAAGARLRALLGARDVEIIDLGRRGATIEKTRVLANGHMLVRIDRGERGDVLRLTEDARVAVHDASALLVSDYGCGVVSEVHGLLAGATELPIVWDPHPRGVAPVPKTTVATPNFREASAFVGAAALLPDIGTAIDIARALRRQWHVGAIAVTLSEHGAVYVDGSSLPLVVPSSRVENGDACGAGDAFAARLALSLCEGALPSEAVAAAVRTAGEYVAGRGRRPNDGVAPNLQTRIVATSGCFDLLHAGHIHMLEAARRLGDQLVVLLNSDASVQRIKGAHRPLVCQEDRANVLRALTCVDDVVVFDDDTPARALEQLRPAVFVKGGDYGAGDIPESDVVAAWGGRTVVVPYLEGYSTTRLAKEGLGAE